MRFLLRLVAVLAVVVVAGGVGFFAWASRHPEIASITPPDPELFDTATIEQGRILADIGACATCHISQEGRQFAGGLTIETPFGMLHSTNITPDPDTGIGTWSEEAFIRAMREGVDREGNYLYPAFPYDHFTRMTDEDLVALYAYFMTREPVSYIAPDNGLRFPYSIRPLMAGWNHLFLDRGPFEPDPTRDAQWNRGAYLVESVAHCGACHTPRNGFGAVSRGNAFDGGVAEGWHVPPLADGSPAPVPWTVNAMVNYLIDGWDRRHGVAAGPMLAVVNHLNNVSEDDVFAMAEYLVSLQTPPAEGAAQAAIADAEAREYGNGARPTPADPDLANGEAVYDRACANCHKVDSETVLLALTGTVNAPDARNVLYVLFDGIDPPRGSPDRTMPGYGQSLTDPEIVNVVNFIRDHFTDLPAWDDTAAQLAAIRRERQMEVATDGSP